VRYVQLEQHRVFAEKIMKTIQHCIQALTVRIGAGRSHPASL